MTSAFTVTASRGRHAANRDAKKRNGDGGEGDGGEGGGGGVATEAGGGGLTRAEARARRRAESARRGGRWWWVGGLVVVAGLAYVPLLLVRPGLVTPDTKTYLYLDPLSFLSQAAFMWNPTVGLGTVTHEYIGYLLPMGPFYAVFHLLGVPVWVVQRLWLGSILCAAGLGMLYLCRILGMRGPGPTAAALAYMLSPYFLQYAGRISVILLPWAGLPFMLGLTIVALR
ncbi:MAG TPA: alpha-(1-_3)-arabinofuranosyltransferase family protein, partial [Acidimicrobiales bacterium]